MTGTYKESNFSFLAVVSPEEPIFKYHIFFFYFDLYEIESFKFVKDFYISSKN